MHPYYFKGSRKNWGATMVIDFIPKVHWILDCQAFRVFHPEFGVDIIYKCWTVIEKSL